MGKSKKLAASSAATGILGLSGAAQLPWVNTEETPAESKAPQTNAAQTADEEYPMLSQPARRRGRPRVDRSQDTRSQAVLIKLKPETHASIKQAAQDADISMTKLIAHVLEEHFGPHR